MLVYISLKESGGSEVIEESGIGSFIFDLHVKVSTVVRERERNVSLDSLRTLQASLKRRLWI